MNLEKKPSGNNKNLIIPILIFIGVAIGAFLLTSFIISLFK
jgi:hypothetical protein